MNVGVVLGLPEELTVLNSGAFDSPQVQWEQWRSNAGSMKTNAVVAGPISATAYTTIPVAIQASNEALPGSVTVYLGANRGRGQAYPSGAASNLVMCFIFSKWSCARPMLFG